MDSQWVSFDGNEISRYEALISRLMSPLEFLFFQNIDKGLNNWSLQLVIYSWMGTGMGQTITSSYKLCPTLLPIMSLFHVDTLCFVGFNLRRHSYQDKGHYKNASAKHQGLNVSQRFHHISRIRSIYTYPRPLFNKWLKMTKISLVIRRWWSSSISGNYVYSCVEQFVFK